MSLELEQLLSECSKAGVIFYHRFGVITLRFTKGKVENSLMEKMSVNKHAIKKWIVDGFSHARCIDCAISDTCVGECSIPPPALGSLPIISGEDPLRRDQTK